jgi:hypothetical protein
VTHGQAGNNRGGTEQADGQNFGAGEGSWLEDQRHDKARLKNTDLLSARDARSEDLPNYFFFRRTPTVPQKAEKPADPGIGGLGFLLYRRAGLG